MERISLREAAEKTARSVTTLRRYIRSGRLRADKLPGRFGPEYFVTAEQLEAAGCEARERGPDPIAPARLMAYPTAQRCVACQGAHERKVSGPPLTAV